MSFFPDMGTISLVAAGPRVRAIGYLDRDHPFQQGDPPAKFRERLPLFAITWAESARLLGFPLFLGGHLCEFCEDRALGMGDFGVPIWGVLFVAPTLIEHYVERHRYLPPADFITAVMRAPLPGTLRYVFRAGRFANMRMSIEDEQRIGEAIKAWVLRERALMEPSNDVAQTTSSRKTNPNDR
jgi:hypothetical protein